jgi:hypothetical protein
MRLTHDLVPLRIRFAKYSEARLAIRQQYSPKFYWLAPEPKRRTSKPQPQPAPRGPSRRGKR